MAGNVQPGRLLCHMGVVGLLGFQQTGPARDEPAGALAYFLFVAATQPHEHLWRRLRAGRQGYIWHDECMELAGVLVAGLTRCQQPAVHAGVEVCVGKTRHVDPVERVELIVRAHPDLSLACHVGRAVPLPVAVHLRRQRARIQPCAQLDPQRAWPLIA